MVELCLQLWLVKVEGCERNQLASLSHVLYIKILLYAYVSEIWLGLIRCLAETIIGHWLLVLFFFAHLRKSAKSKSILGDPVWVPWEPDLVP